ncbi:MauE/DoxX family redox-associated membrane protein [Mucilaginibacter sp. UR6-1]|uniref:MauE/DoxX family redox-associated membrane protein n=1 Tax=Mucilaginibacter sp. UR6-1 TaxID=1435643 RepID=UPI00351CF921
MPIRQHNKAFITTFSAGLLALLWFYAALSKLMDFQFFKEAIHKQPLYPVIQFFVIYGLPAAEIITGGGLLIARFSKSFFYVSAIMLYAFTVYIALILFRAFGHIPCGCGGVIGHMGWTFHLWFNLVFLALNTFTIIIYQRKEPGDN